MHIGICEKYLMKMHERLKLARQKAGFQTAKEASLGLGIPYGTYSGHESGTRGIKSDEIKRYATFFNTSVVWLALGKEELKSSIPKTAVIFGSIDNPDGFVSQFESRTINKDEMFINALPLDDALQGVIRVESNALIGFASCGSYVYFELTRSMNYVKQVDDYLDLPCLLEVKIVDKWHSLVGVPNRSSDGLYDVERFLLPTLRHVSIRSASPVIGIILKNFGDRLLEASAPAIPPSA